MITSKQTLAMVLLIQLIGYIGIALPYPIFSPLFLSNNPSTLSQFMQLPPMMLMGMVLAAYPLGLLMGGSYLGSLSDRVGRKPVLFWSLLATIIANAISAIAIIQQNYLLLVAARFITGLCEGNIAVARAIITDLGNSINKTKSFGYLSAASYSGYLIGPIIAGSVAHFGYYWPFLIATLLSLITFVIVSIWLPETLLKKSTHLKPQLSQLTFLKTPKLLSALFVYILATLGVNTYYEFYPVLLVQSYQMDSLQIAWSTVALTVSMIVVAVWFLLPLEKLMGRKWVITLGFIGLGVLMTLLQFHLDSFKLLAHFILTGIVIAMYNSLYLAWISEKFSHLDQGQLMGSIISSFCLTNIIMALAGSFIALFSMSSLMIMGGILAMMSGLWFLYINQNFVTEPITESYDS